MKKDKLKLITYLKRRFYQPGLTLIELLVVLGLIGVLGGIVAIEGDRARNVARDRAMIIYLSEAPVEALSYRGKRATFMDFCQSPAWRQIQGGIIGQGRTIADIICLNTETHFCAQVALHTGGHFCVDSMGNFLRVDTPTCHADHVGCVEPVGDIPIIFASPTVFYFEATANVVPPPPFPQTLSIWNAGPGVLNWEIRAKTPPTIPDWLKFSLTTGRSAGPGEVNSVSVSIVTPLPPPGSHSAVIEIRDRNVPPRAAEKRITVNLTVIGPPTVNLSANPNPVTSGATTTLTWSSTNATSCTATAGPGFSTGGLTSGSDVSSALTVGATFSIRCDGPGGSTERSITVTIIGDPTVSLSANPNPVTSGATTVLTWSSTNATSCTATAGPGFSTDGAISGNDTSSALTTTTTFSIRCDGLAGTTPATASVEVTIETACEDEEVVCGDWGPCSATAPCQRGVKTKTCKICCWDWREAETCYGPGALCVCGVWPNEYEICVPLGSSPPGCTCSN